MSRKLKTPSRARVRAALPPSLRPVFDAMPGPVQNQIALAYGESQQRQSQLDARNEDRLKVIEERRGIQAKIARFLADRSRGWTPNKAEQAEYNQDVADNDDLTAEIDELQAPLPPIRPFEDVINYLRANSNAVFRYIATAYDGPPTLAALAKNRAELEKLKLKKKRLASTSLTLAEGDAALDAAVKAKALGGDVRPQLVLRQVPGLHGRKQGKPSWTYSQDGSISAERVLAIMFDLFGDEIAAKYKARIRKDFDARASISAFDRIDQMAAIDLKIMRLEHMDEAIYRACRDAGLSVERRPDAAIEAVLSLEVTDKSRVTISEAGKTRGSLQIAHAGDRSDDTSGDFDFG